MTDEKPRLGRDVYVALAAVGWADGHLDQDEADAIVRTALEEEAAALLAEPAQPHGQGPLVQGGGLALGTAGGHLRGPRVHRDVRTRPEQGQVAQPNGVRAQLCQGRRNLRSG